MKTSRWKPRRLRRGGKRVGFPSAGRGNIEKGWAKRDSCYTARYESETHGSHRLSIGLSLRLDTEIPGQDAGRPNW